MFTNKKKFIWRKLKILKIEFLSQFFSFSSKSCIKMSIFSLRSRFSSRTSFDIFQWPEDWSRVAINWPSRERVTSLYSCPNCSLIWFGVILLYDDNIASLFLGGHLRIVNLSWNSGIWYLWYNQFDTFKEIIHFLPLFWDGLCYVCVHKRRCHGNGVQEERRRWTRDAERGARL